LQVSSNGDHPGETSFEIFSSVLDQKKTTDIRERMKGVVCVFGNLDSISLLRTGTPAQIVREVLRQSEGDSGNFVVANGSPVAHGTPALNVSAMINTVKEELFL
jgi:uroporphyrinogen-III decarboxylase